MSEFALRFIIANLAASAAILIVLALRKPIRAAFGARIAYALWLLAPLAALGSLVPPRVVEIVRPATTFAAPEIAAAEPAVQTAVLPETLPQSAPVFTTDSELSLVSSPDLLSSLDPWSICAFVWLMGVIATALWLARNQSRFMAEARAGLAGPAVAGFLKPRIITPSDFEERFDRSERDVILAHETMHLSRNDAQINAAVAMARCLAWFNPLVHMGAHIMRIDQELACDAAVVARHPRAKAVYASALLKAQLAARPLPLGCYWPAGEDHPLTERIEMLKRAAPGRARRLAGAGAVILLAAAAGAAAWAAKPPETRLVEARPSQDAPGPAQSQQMDRALSRPGGDTSFGGAATPRVLDTPTPAPQQTPAPAAGPDFDPKDSVHLLGKVERIDFSDKTYVAFVRATSIAACPTGPSQVNTKVWELAPMPYWGDRDAVERDLMNQNVYVRGFNARDKSCTPNCRMEVRAVFKANGATSLSQASMLGFSDPALMCAPSTQPVRFEPQQTITTPSPSRMSGAGTNQPVFVRGKVEKITFDDTAYAMQLGASSIGRDTSSSSRPTFWGEDINTALWQLSSINYFGARDAIEKDLLGREVIVRGNTSSGLSCASDCQIKVRELVVPKSTAVPTPSGRPFGISDFAMYYDTTEPMLMSGKVERLEFSDSTFDAWIQTKGYGVDPGVLYQVRSDYFLPRADIEARLRNRDIVASGWPARGDTYGVCSPVCGMYAEMMWLADGSPMRPGSNRPISPPPVATAPSPQSAVPATPQPTRYEPQQIPGVPRDFVAFASLFDADDPILVKGKVMQVDLTQPNVYLWVQASEATEGKAGMQPNTSVFRAMLGRAATAPDWVNSSLVGREVTVRGYRAKDKTCTDACLINGKDVTMDGIKNVWPTASPAAAAPASTSEIRRQPEL